MSALAIGICTYKRPEGLARVLDAISHQRLVKLAERDVFVLVIDNCPEGSAKSFVDDIAAGSRFKIDYQHEPRKGLSFARNAVLETAHNIGAQTLAFIDDDEMPEPDWIEALSQRMTETEAAVAIGPAYPMFSCTPGKRLPLAAYATRTQVVGGYAAEGYTCNALLDLNVIKALGLTFDSSLNDVGGEDTMFFKAILDAGHRIAWAENAIVHDLVPPQRMTALWLWRRWYRTGSIEARLGAHSPASLKGRMVNLGKGCARLGAGSGRILASAVVSGWRRPSRTVASFYTACRGAGLIANVVGRDYKEYAQTNYR
ncbi:MAG: glycosyltransferase family A protein [Pseudomonadota bacterium]